MSQASPTTAADLPRDLGDGLTLRRATPDDAARLADFNGRVHAAPYDTVAAAWTRDLLRGDHPTGAHERILLVESVATGEIASSSCLIPQTWSYAGIPFAAGRPELIGTAPAYRRRGLVREQFRTLHAWAASEEQRMQCITGIPYYYRQFGYEPALAVGSLMTQAHALPAPLPQAGAPLRLRPATVDDVPAIARFVDLAATRSLVNCQRDDRLWRYELFGRDPGSDYFHAVELVETIAGETVGLFAYQPARDDGQLQVALCEVAPGQSWRAVGTVILQRLRAIGESQTGASGPFSAIGLTGGPDHPLTRAFPELFAPSPREFFFYIRIPDLPALLGTIAPELERRLSESVLAGHSGTLRLNFYRSGLTLTFADGRLTGIDPAQPRSDDASNAGFPDLTFLQLLLGARTLAELEHAFADCRASTQEARAILDLLFPRVSSAPWPIG